MEGADRLNELTDDMLVNNIMSRLDCTTKEVIRTTATISKRWKNLWSRLPRLIFTYHDGLTYFGRETDLCHYISIIDNTLNQCPANLNLKKFELYIDYNSLVNSEFNSRVNSWIRYAISRNVEDVDLWLLPGMDLDQHFTYDDELFFNNLCFNRVNVSNCKFNPPNGVISWERLECLCLWHVTLDEDMIVKILSGSPCLESLELEECTGFRRIDVTSRNLKTLVFSGYCYWSEEDYTDCIKINAPYISSLAIKGEFEVELVLLDVSSLIKAELDYFIDRVLFSEINHEEMLRGLLESLDHVKDVILNNFCWEVSSFNLNVGQFPDFADLVTKFVPFPLSPTRLIIDELLRKRLLVSMRFHYDYQIGVCERPSS